MPQLWAVALALQAFRAQASVVLTTLHSFQVFTNGAQPWSALVQGSDGDLYGTTYSGGTNGGRGTVFKMSTNGALTSLYSFTGGIDGYNPNGLVQGSDGYFYGTSASGVYSGRTGEGYGTVFKISTNGALTTLYSFTGGIDGAYPAAGLVQGSDGYFYGTTIDGGAYTNQYGQGQGTVFKIATNGVLTTLHSFSGTNDGANPAAALIQGRDGYFYGTAGSTVFKIGTNGALTTLYSFTGGNDGGGPAGLVQGSDGNFYGTTDHGGTNGDGTVFKMSTNGTLTTLYSFSGTNDGANPNGLVQGSDRNFYGTTYGGTVFKTSTAGVLTTLYSFTGGNDGASPEAGLVQGGDGNFYGTTFSGGTDWYAGTVFKISTAGALTTLYSFTGSNDGASPEAGLVQGRDGYFYGTAGSTVFKIGANGALTTLYSFSGTNDGANPNGLVQGRDGYFYGTTLYGGTDWYAGTVFKISTNGTLTTLYSFTGANDGANPWAALIQGSDGYFYGTTSNGGTSGYGTVFRIGTNGELTTLYSFTGTNDGAAPYAALVRGSDGYFYGTTSYRGINYGGTVFKISTNGALTTLYSFGGNDGWTPNRLVQGNDGYFYGTTQSGGTTGAGTVFKISPNGVLTSLYSFPGGNVGIPSAELVQGRDGNFYGTIWVPPPAPGYPPSFLQGYGNVFKMSTNGTLTSLYSFTGGNDGGGFVSVLMQGSDGSFYGTTAGGGQGGEGTVFRLSVVQVAPAFQAVTLTNGTLSLTWSTESGGTYQVQYNSDLGSSNWTSLGSAITATGATLSATDSVTNAPRRFYRLVLLP